MQRFYELWSAREVEAAAKLFDLHAVAHAVEGWPEPGPWHGREAILKELHTLQDGWHDYTIRIEDIASHDEWVLTRHHTHLRGSSGLDVDFRHSVAFRLSGRKIIEVRFYWNHGEALKAVGLAE